MNLEERLDDRLARGKNTITRSELEELNYSYSGLRRALSRLKDKNKVNEPRQGFFVIVPPQYRNRTVPPRQYIDQLMDYEDREYYVGLLSAAQTYGASHQSAMVFQVVVPEQRRSINQEDTTINFITNSTEFTPEMVNQGETSAGYYTRSTPNVTVADCVYYQKRSGGLSNVATIIAELHDQLSPDNLLKYARKAHGMATVQRVGYLLKTLGLDDLSRPFETVVREENHQPVPLNPSGRTEDKPRDNAFNIIENYPVEPDVKPTGDPSL